MCHKHKKRKQQVCSLCFWRIAIVRTGGLLGELAVGAVISGSLALLAGCRAHADRCRRPGLGAGRRGTGPATAARTWGYLRAEALGAAAQAAVLLAVGVFVLVQGVRRLFEPPEVTSGLMLVFGVVGLVGNLVELAILARSRGANLNMRAAFLEVVNDALGSVAVLVAASSSPLPGGCVPTPSPRW